MTFELSKKIRFEAAHHLPSHLGKCRNHHGHSFVGHIIVAGETLHNGGSSAGMLQDFSEISAVVKPILEEKLDHRDLNETLPLENPTSEEIARWLYAELKPKLPMLVAIKIEETCTSECTYRPKQEENR